MLDFDRLAADFDRFLGLIEPVGHEVLRHLPLLADGSQVLDVACGTGEPGLTLALESPGLRVIGVDAVQSMIDLAQAKAARAGAGNARFETMTAEALALPDGSIDAVVSRFGLLMFGNRDQSARELARVLRAGGVFSAAVWDGMEDNTLVRTVVEILRPHVRSATLAPFDGFARAYPILKIEESGLAEVQSRPFTWEYAFDDEVTLWQFVSRTGMFERGFGELSEATKDHVRQSLRAAFAPHQRNDASYRIPHTCLIYTGRKRPAP